jgi:2-iminobutanoate/2-iminopropanoate deaminase
VLEPRARARHYELLVTELLRRRPQVPETRAASATLLSWCVRVMLESAGSDLAHVVHVNVYMSQMSDFEAMNAAYVEKLGDHRPARTVIGVRELPKPGVLLTMNLTAVAND